MVEELRSTRDPYARRFITPTSCLQATGISITKCRARCHFAAPDYIRIAMHQHSPRTGSSSETAALHYAPGLHLIVDGEGLGTGPLSDLEGFRRMVEERIDRSGLIRVGAVHHAFPGAGFTSVICLTESHLSIHTWPEHGRVTFDVFLSNFSRVNDAAAEGLVAAIKAFLGAGRYTEHRLNR